MSKTFEEIADIIQTYALSQNGRLKNALLNEFNKISHQDLRQEKEIIKTHFHDSNHHENERYLKVTMNLLKIAIDFNAPDIVSSLLSAGVDTSNCYSIYETETRKMFDSTPHFPSMYSRPDSEHENVLQNLQYTAIQYARLKGANTTIIDKLTAFAAETDETTMHTSSATMSPI